MRAASHYLFLRTRTGYADGRLADSCVLELRDDFNHQVVVSLPVPMVVALVAFQYCQAELTAALLPAAPIPLRAPGPHDTGQPRLRGAEKRRLRGRKGPQEST